jgi:hypothetical protein
MKLTFASLLLLFIGCNTPEKKDTLVCLEHTKSSLLQ